MYKKQYCACWTTEGFATGDGGYFVEETGWRSYDGIEWYNQNGELVDSPDFNDSSIKLSGGPDDGKIVD
jgi:hypothetical protein